MRSWLRHRVVGAGFFHGILALLFAILSPASAMGQVSERMQVMVTNLVPLDGADDDFGKDLAKALRELIDDLATHRALEEKEIKDALKPYDLKMEDLDCGKSVQLAVQGVAGIVFCGSYTENRRERTYALSGVRFIAPGSSPVEVPDKTWSEDDVDTAAEEIAAAFEAYVNQLRLASFCSEFYETGLYTDAERACGTALEIAPNDPQVRLVLAQVLRQTERLDEAYGEVRRVLELDPGNGTGLQLAGFLATTLGRPQEESRAYYDTFLRGNPGNVPVRMKIAYELAQAGDPEGAMLFVEEGLAIEPENIDLLVQHASFAIKAGLDLRADGQPMSTEAAGFIGKGLESYRKVYATQGAQMDLDHLNRMIAAFSELGRLEEALDLTGEVLEAHGDEVRFWAVKGDVLKKLDRLDEALLALDEVEALDSAYPNIRAKRGQWLVDAGREEEALPVLKEAVETGEQSADVIANLLFSVAVGKGIQPREGPKDYDFALRMIDMARTFEPGLSEMVIGRLDFYKAFCIYLVAEKQSAPENIESARLTLPRFQEVQQLLALPHVAGWVRTSQAATQKSFQDMRDGVVQYIEIQQAIIKRGN